MTVYNAAFSKDANIKIRKFEDLNDFKYGLRRGRFKLLNTLKKRVSAKPIIVSSDKAAFKMLAASRMQIVLSESALGRAIISSSKNYAGIEEIGRLASVEIYAYMHKKHKALARKIAQNLAAMKLDGSFEKITKQAALRFIASLSKNQNN